MMGIDIWLAHKIIIIFCQRRHGKCWNLL